MIEKIEIKNLTHQFISTRKIFDNLNANLPTNEIVFFDGGIGSGRSSLLKMLAALMMPQCGSVIFNDKLVSEMTFEEFLPLRLQTGYSFEYAGLLNNRTLYDNLLLPLQYHSLASPQEAAARVESLCAQFGLSEVAHQRPSTVSGSQRKACIVARAFVMKPELLLLDEPFAGLSAAMVLSLKDFIAEQRTNGNLKHVFLTCQNPRDVEGWATKRIVVEPTQLTCADFVRSAKGAA